MKQLRTSISCLALVTAFSVSAPSADASDWISGMLDDRCSTSSSQDVTDSVRNAIESSVRRSESAIQSPAPIGDLSCLNDLMTLPLDTFSSIGGLLSDLSAGLTNLMNFDLDIDIAGMVCGFAAEKWSELTQPLTNITNLSSFISNPMDALSQISAPPLSGQSNFADSSGYSGSIQDYVPPSTDISEGTSSLPIFPNYVDEGIPVIEADPNQALGNAAVLTQFADYLACRIAQYRYDSDGRNLYLQGGYQCDQLAPRSSDASFAPASSSGTVIEPAVSSRILPDGINDRPSEDFGQQRPAPIEGQTQSSRQTTTSTSSSAGSDPIQDIWNNMGRQGN